MSLPSACWSCRGAVTDDFFCSTCQAVQPPDPDRNFFQLFDLSPTFSLDVAGLDAPYRGLQYRFHPDRFATRTTKERRFSLEQVTRLNQAYKTLRDALSRAGYLLDLLGHAADGQRKSDPAFLMEVMESRETLEEVDMKADDAWDRLEDLRKEASQQAEAEEGQLAGMFQNHFKNKDSGALEKAPIHVDRLRYHRRFLEELDRMEERLYEE